MMIKQFTKEEYYNHLIGIDIATTESKEISERVFNKLKR